MPWQFGDSACDRRHCGNVNLATITRCWHVHFQHGFVFVLSYLDMHTKTVSAQNPSAPLPTGSHPWGEWLTVQGAVTYCQTKGLSRTPKTIRKWAMRSQNLDGGTGDVVSRSQDTENGFRWLLERSSLDVKIAQELEFDSRKKAESFLPNLLEPVVTGADGVEAVQLNEQATEQVGTNANPSEAVQTLPHPDSAYLTFLEKQLDRAHQQIDVKDRQIDALLERDRETNFLIQGLQGGLTRLLNRLPGREQDDFRDAA